MKLREVLGYQNGFQAIFVTTFPNADGQKTKVFTKPKKAKKYIEKQESCTVEVLWLDEDTDKPGFDWCDFTDGVAENISAIGLWYGSITEQEMEENGVKWGKEKTNESA